MDPPSAPEWKHERVQWREERGGTRPKGVAEGTRGRPSSTVPTFWRWAAQPQTNVDLYSPREPIAPLGVKSLDSCPQVFSRLDNGFTAGFYCPDGSPLALTCCAVPPHIRRGMPSLACQAFFALTVRPAQWVSRPARFPGFSVTLVLTFSLTVPVLKRKHIFYCHVNLWVNLFHGNQQ